MKKLSRIIKSVSDHCFEADNDAASEPLKRDELDEAELDYEADEVGGHDEKPLSDDDDLVTGKDGESAGDETSTQIEKQVRVPRVFAIRHDTIYISNHIVNCTHPCFHFILVSKSVLDC